MKQKSSKKKNYTRSLNFKVKQPSMFIPVSAMILFKFIIMLAVLTVACIAIISRVFEPVVWTFLGILAGSVALSSNRLDSVQDLNEKTK